jgi:hypothetical protein
MKKAKKEGFIIENQNFSPENTEHDQLNKKMS